MSKRYSIFIAALFCGFIAFFVAADLLLPDRTFSQQENRVLQQMPKLGPGSFDLGLDGTLGSLLLSDDRGDFFSGKFMSSFETYVTDQFPGRDLWIAAKARLEVLSGKQENNGVYIGAGDTLIPRFDRPDETRVQNNLNYVNKLVDNVDIPVYFGLIPGKVSVWADRLPAHAPNADEAALIAQARAATGATWVDADRLLRAHAGEEIYYRLDHHWTSLGAYYGYAAVLEAMGRTPADLADYEKQVVSADFNGTTYSTSGVRWMAPDSMEIYVPEDGVTVQSWRTGTQPEAGALYDWSKLEVKDKYSFFLGGNQSLAVIDTPNTQGEKLLVVRDSYSDSLAPFLTGAFSQVHLFDPRYNKTPLTQYIAENGIDRVLVLYSVANFVNDSNLFVLGQ